ncbi:DUF4038 domain-containing protein [Telluribacter sp.]|jgi:hypothetical protein|uniref:apiosidase-like domain-containing protein n=1 Tax=Telluribacter sp. TaxID=1978767 RepID=UPI002E13C04A|nr:DUF4038 domain-containing protein [Telluribacter sp.]
MKKTLFILGGLFLGVVLNGTTQSTKQTSPVPGPFPVTVAPSQTHLLDKTNRPFLVMADVCLPLLSKLTLEETRFYLQTRKSQTFNTVLFHLFPSQPDGKNKVGKVPFLAGSDLSKPNPAYFDYVEKVVEVAASQNQLVGLVVNWPAPPGTDSLELAKNKVDFKKMSEYLGQRFKAHPNIFWIVGPQPDWQQQGLQPTEFAQSLRKVAPRQLISLISPPTVGAAGDTVGTSGLDFNLIKVYFAEKAGPEATEQPEVGRPVPFPEISRYPKRPFLLAELAGEEPPVRPALLARHLAYRSLLGGGLGYCYRSNVAHFPAGWKQKMKEEGIQNMEKLSTIVKGIPWNLMQPDTSLSFLVSGQTDWNNEGYITSSFLPNRRMAALYIPANKEIEVDLTQLEGDHFKTVWYSPRTGRRWSGAHFPASPNQKIAPPAENPDWDWVLIIGYSPE